MGHDIYALFCKAADHCTDFRGVLFPAVHGSHLLRTPVFIGMGAIILSGIALKRLLSLRGDPAPFIMELPAYHLPQLGTVLKSAIDRAVAFIKKAGTIIFVACIFIWFTSSYNFTFDRVGEEESILAFFGRLLAPIFAPLGWGTWRGAVATITGLVAKENVIGTFGILYRPKVGFLKPVQRSGKCCEAITPQ